MRIYLDKENVRSILTIKDKDFRSTIFRIFQRQVDTVLNFSAEEIKYNDELSAFASIFTEGYTRPKKEVYSGIAFPEQRPLKSNFYKNLDRDQLCSVFLINDEKISEVKIKGAIAIAGPDEATALFDNLTFFKKDYDFDLKMRIGGDKFKKWEDLKQYRIPFTDIIIIDKYLFSDRKKLQNNYCKLLETMLENKKNKVNIILYTSADKTNGIPDCQLDISEIKQITAAAAEKANSLRPEVTLIKVNDLHNKISMGEHDRTIWTNYCRIYSGDTLNYYNDKGERITRAREIHLSSHLKEENELLGKELLRDLQSNINILISSNRVEGDKKSNFLTFE